MPFWTYILYDKDRDSFYIGQTSNLHDRIKRHQEKRSKYTKRGNWKLVYKEIFSRRTEAIKREIYLKSLKNKEYVKWMIGRAPRL